MSSNMIITISRQPGCGGLEIGQRLARRLDFPYVDKKTLAQAVDKLTGTDGKSQIDEFWSKLGRLPVHVQCGLERYIPDVASIVSDRELHEDEAEILRQLVGEGPAVVVGRAGFHRFSAHPKLLRVFITGEQDYRIENYQQLYCLDRAAAEELLATVDRATERYIYNVSGHDMFDLRNYNLCLDISRIDFNRVIECIIEYAHYSLAPRDKATAE
jgi:cytidylate kinase